MLRAIMPTQWSFLSAPPGLRSESHSEIQSRRALRQRVALIVTEPGALMQRQSIILHDAELHRRVESVTETVAEGKEWIRVSTCWSELQLVGISREIPVKRCTC